MNYYTKNKKLIIQISAKNNQKFRFKTRENNLDFGQTFATRTTDFNKNVYLEWQIGYDATVIDVKNKKKSTSLKKLSFIGANGKEKYPYELSEFLYEGIKLGLISSARMHDLLKEIKKYNNFIDHKKIKVEHSSKISFNGMNFQETAIKLPTFFMIETIDSTQIEIAIEKQQYATGVQPMIYFCIPATSFTNFSDLVGRPSINTDILDYVIDKSNVNILLDMLKIFAMSSKRHNHDMVEIIKILIKLIKL